MRIVVYGSRYWERAIFVFKHLDALREKIRIDQVIEGDQHGVDRIAGSWARRRGISNLKFPASDYEDRGPVAKYLARNQAMIDVGRPELGVEFPGGSGTADMHRRLVQANIPIRVVEFGEAPDVR